MVDEAEGSNNVTPFPPKAQPKLAVDNQDSESLEFALTFDEEEGWELVPAWSLIGTCDAVSLTIWRRLSPFC